MFAAGIYHHSSDIKPSPDRWTWLALHFPGLDGFGSLNLRGAYESPNIQDRMRSTMTEKGSSETETSRPLPRTSKVLSWNEYRKCRTPHAVRSESGNLTRFCPASAAIQGDCSHET
jgi:hypothetical protein